MNAMLRAAATLPRWLWWRTATACRDPCGTCRQALAEFCREEFSVYIAKASALEDYEVACLATLLPNSFKLTD
jgi:cytidine deaminase